MDKYNEQIILSKEDAGIDEPELFKHLEQSLEGIKSKLKKVLLLPPDFTRSHSGAGIITNQYYKLLKDTCEIDVMPALGTHEPMSKTEWLDMFGPDLPFELMKVHNWRNDVVKLGIVPGTFIEEVSEGLINTPVEVEVNKLLLDPSYDLIISIGQVVPHEVVGMANYSKNIFVGCGGSSMINSSHMLGAFYGMERVMGKDFSPVRKVFDYAQENFISSLPLMYVLTVTKAYAGKVAIRGLFTGRERSIFESAVKLSQDLNLSYVEKPLKKVVVNLDSKEFKSTWIGNKAIYRTRMAIASGGELIILAPGICKFGEDSTNDELIRKYGYIGREKVLELCKTQEDLKGNLSVAAHLIHGSSDGRFSITYAPGGLTKEETLQAGFKYLSLEEAIKKYNPDKLKDGINTLDDGEEIYYISNPALGLWSARM